MATMTWEPREGGVGVQSAIVIVGPEIREEESSLAADEASAQPSRAITPDHEGIPLVCVEVLGLSVVARLIEELWHAGIGMVSVLGNISNSSFGFDSAARLEPRSIQPCSPKEAWQGATQQLLTHKESGAEAILVVRAGAYVDLDLKDFFQFHREHGQAVTRVFDQEGPLDIWIVDPEKIWDPAELSDSKNILSVLRAAEPVQYLVRGYVNRLQHPRDLRRLVVDSLSSRSRLRPLGTESRPGVWIDESAQLHRDARIVAPAFVGRGARIAEQCLITRCSNVESNCQIDYGTVVEDSSILSNSYVGIGLDLSHSIVDGNNLLNLERGVTMEIADPCVIRQNRVSRPEKNLKLPIAFGPGSV
jgi:NDP-sugar pyrophosphorylase family protein